MNSQKKLGLQAVEAMEEQREKLYHLQMRAGIDASLVVDLRLSGMHAPSQLFC